MRRIIFSMLLMAIISNSFGTPRGTTSKIPLEKLTPIFPSNSEIIPAPSEKITFERPKTFTRTLDSLFIGVMLGPGEFIAVFVDDIAETLGYSPSPIPVHPSLLPWINTAPDNMKNQLILNLSHLDPTYAPLYADMLAAADPLWLDELYFCLGHIAHEVLELPELSFLLPENVREMYRHDSLLNYVEILDLGTPGGSDHHTVARYVTKDTGMTSYDTVTLESAMFYRYVMFPKITDEIPLYIDPATGDPVDPWSGRFWRTWFWSVDESTSATSGWALGDSLRSIDALWNGISGNDTDNGAVGVVTRWIKDCLEFGSGEERPTQPVRIYALHLGRCGEHEDITCAAARMALIPARGIEAISTDHVWNEFWTGWRWAGW